MFLAHLTILGCWLWLWLLFYGWGTLMCLIGRCGRSDNTSLVVNPWIGVGAVVALAQLWHFAAPLANGTFIVASVVGIGSAVLFGLRPAKELVGIFRANPWPFIAGLLAILYLANRSLGSQDYTDNGLYYLNAIRWNSDYAIVPGLANLYNRLGFNNSNFLLHAMLELGTWRGYTGHLINGFLASLTVPIVVPGIQAIVARRGAARQLGWFTVGIGMIVAVTVVDRRVSTAHPDFAAALLASVAAWRFLTFALVESESVGKLLRWNLLAIVIPATTAVTFKTTVIFFAGLAGISVAICLYLLALRGPRPWWTTTKLLCFMAPWAIAIFVPWIIRGYVVSGYPLYPAAVAAAPVDWAFSPKAAAELREDIYAYARTYYKNIDQGYQPGWGWVPTWFVQVILIRAPVEVVLAALISLATLFWLTVAGLRSNRGKLGDSHADSTGVANLALWLLALSYAGSLLAWFATAPSPRMGSFAWWGLTGTLLALASQTVPSSAFAHHRKLVLVALMGLLALPTMEQIGLVELRYRKNPEMPEFGHHFYSYYPFVLPTEGGGFPPIPQAKLLQKPTNSGLILNLPEIEPDGKPGLLWESPLPASRTLNPRLELRKPGDLQHGFKVTGEEIADPNAPHTRNSHDIQ